MEKTIKILFILPSLRAGGAERVVSFIAQNLDRLRFTPILLIVGFEKDSVFTVNNIEVHFLNKHRVLDGVRGIFSKLKSLKPDIVMTSIAHLTAVTVIQSLYFRKIKFVSRDANIKTITKQYHDSSILFGDNLNKISYKLLDAIICQSKDMKDELIDLYPFTAKKTYVINNPITTSLPLLSLNNSNATSYITVGRLHNEKGHSRILEALSQLDFKFTYTIIGSGPHKHLIEEKAQSLGLVNAITWIDYTNTVEEYLSKSSVFIQGSYAEGFPNALLESCVVGTPVVAFHAPGGTSEIIENGLNGFLVSTEEELKNKLISLKQNPLNKRIVQETVAIKFNKELILSQYEDVFTNLMKN